MKSTQIMKILTSVLAVSLLSIGTGAVAQPGIDRMVEQLELTDEQREQLTALREEQRAETQAMAEQRRAATETEREAMRAAAEERMAAQQQRMSAILTPEQMTQLEEMRTAAMEQRAGRMEGMNAADRPAQRGGDMRNQANPGRPMGPAAGPRRSE